ncbi:hypothetical protein BKI52_44675 [marine bacterium AO1-C]|nr:hypothetical protein BKI52_44675 [marine bacterium AO1-C]
MSDPKNIPQNDLKSHQYEDIYFEYDEPFTVDKARKTSFLLYYGVGLFVIILVLGFVITIPREIHMQFELTGGLQEKIGQYPDKVFIEQRLVEVGEEVKAGTPLMAISSEKITNYLAQMQAVKSARARLMGSALTLYQKNMAHLNKAIQNAYNEQLLLEQRRQRRAQRFAAERKVLGERQALAAKNLQRNQSLRNNKVIADRDLEITQNTLKERQYEILTARQRYQSELILIDEQLARQKRTILELEQKRQLDSLTRKDEEALLHKRQKDIEAGLRLNFGDFDIRNNRLIIKSPVRGKISLVSFAEALVPAGEMIWKIDAGKQSYVVVSKANSTQIGSLNKGQKVVLKFESFPYLYYGTLKGSIKQVSASPTVKGTYLVSMKITDYNGLEKKIIKGMKGEASAVVEDLPVFYYLFKSLVE